MEQQVYGLPEAVKEVKTLTTRVRERDLALKEVQAALNDRERQLGDLSLEVTALPRFPLFPYLSWNLWGI